METAKVSTVPGYVASVLSEFCHADPTMASVDIAHREASPDETHACSVRYPRCATQVKQ
jgi:hypothetical protein